MYEMGRYLTSPEDVRSELALNKLLLKTLPRNILETPLPLWLFEDSVFTGPGSRPAAHLLERQDDIVVDCGLMQPYFLGSNPICYYLLAMCPWKTAPYIPS